MRNFEKAGTAAGALAGAAVGAKVTASTFWWLGPAYPFTVVAGTLVGGTLGFFTGKNLGEAYDTRFKNADKSV